MSSSSVVCTAETFAGMQTETPDSRHLWLTAHSSMGINTVTKQNLQQSNKGTGTVPAKVDSDSISIMIVEDDQPAMKLMLSVFEMRYPEERFHTAENGVQGLKRFRRLRPAIVITDISMPGVDGLVMASEIKSLCPETIVVAVTAHSEPKNLLRAIEIGISCYILKPLSYDRLFSVLEQSISTVRKEQQLHKSYEQINHYNAELMAKTRELESANRDLEAFNYSVAHDLRTPLSSINAYSQYLLNDCAEKLDEKCIGFLEIILKESIRMNSFIGALLRFSSFSRKNIEKRWTDLSSIVHEIKDSLLLRDPQRKVAFSITEGVKGFCDPILLNVVLENLLVNSWKFSANNEDARIEFDVMNLDDDLVYFIRDNGAGFDKQAAATLFAPFQRIQCDNDIEGYGIGLATVERIIQRHGGRVWADGEKNRGATIYFTL